MRRRLKGAPSPNGNVFVQSFETTNLRELEEMGLRVPMVQLISGSGAPYDLVAAGDERTYADLTTREGLAEIARYAAGVGPAKSLVIPRDADGMLGEPTSLVDDAHAEGLFVHPYTFRNENTFLPTDLRAGLESAASARAIDEHLAFLDAGVDGLFTDNPTPESRPGASSSASPTPRPDEADSLSGLGVPQARLLRGGAVGTHGGRHGRRGRVGLRPRPHRRRQSLGCHGVRAGRPDCRRDASATSL
jgi:hypothetical protein